MKHLVIVKWNVGDEEKERLNAEALGLFKGLCGMEGIHGVEQIKGIPLNENRFDMILKIDMEKEALKAYSESAVHQKWLSEYAKYIDKKAIFDCEGEL